MAQKPQIIDLTKTYIPGDPNAFLQNLVNTDREDGEEKALPIAPYEGYNFLPTSYGYRSYFGLNSTLDIEALGSPCDKILLFQTQTFENILIALCDDGIWSASPAVAANTWTHEITLSVPAPGSHKEWTWCVIENILYLYRQGEASAWKVSTAGVVSTHTPTFLNMAGQMGIFRAKGRLGFWDSANSISWSSIYDLTDFTPSLENLAGNTIFNQVLGRIVLVLSMGDGFNIYGTRSIVGVSFSEQGTILWDGTLVTDEFGIAYPGQVSTGESDKDHYVWTQTGLYKLSGYNIVKRSHEFEPLFTDVTDFLRESRTPIYLDCLLGRYLYICLIDPDYITGLVSFQSRTIPNEYLTLLIGQEEWDGATGTLPAGSATSNQIGSIIGHLLDGSNGDDRKKKNNEYWAPRWDVEIDEVDTRYKSALSYHLDGLVNGTPTFVTPTFLAANDLTLDPATISGTLNPIISGSKVGTLRTVALCRPRVEGHFDAHAVNNCTFLWRLQELEWRNFIYHQARNAEQVALLTSVVVTNGGGSGAAPADSDVTVDTNGYVVFPTGKGTIKGIKASSTELILRKYFESVFRVDKHVRTVIDYTDTSTGSPVDWYSSGLFNYEAFDNAVLYDSGSYTHNCHFQYIKPIMMSLIIHMVFLSQPATSIDNIYLTGASETALAALPNTNAGNYAFDFTFHTTNDFDAHDYSFRIYGTITKSTSNYRRDYRHRVAPDTGQGVRFGDTGSVDTGIATATYTVEDIAGYVRSDYLFKVSASLPIPSSTAVFTETLTSLQADRRVGGLVGFSPAHTDKYFNGKTDGVLNSVSSYTYVQTVTTTYTVAEVLQNYGYSQIRFLLKKWERMQKLPMGGLALLETVAVTPSNTAFDAIYPGTYQGPECLINFHSIIGQSPNDEIVSEMGNYLTMTGTEIPTYTLGGEANYPETIVLDIPGTTFLLQEGSPAPIYPTFVGALVYDFLLKKWGKFSGNFKQLVEYAPINITDNAIVSYANFGMDAGILNADGELILFDIDPVDSLIRYGKIGFTRLGYTNSLEVKLHFRIPSTGTVYLDCSLDGRGLEPVIQSSETFTEAREVTAYVDENARWFAVGISGQFDLQYMEIRGNFAGIR